MYPLHNLVRWRIRLRKALSSSSQTTPKSDGAVENAKVKDDDQLLQEMEELTSVIDRKKKRERESVNQSVEQRYYGLLMQSLQHVLLI
jgi:AdoMet-dependent rRNA methyltransferase SPB1